MEPPRTAPVRFAASGDSGVSANLQLLHFAESKEASAKHVDAPCFLVGTEIENKFIWAWANTSLGLPPMPIYAEYANELQTIGGAL